MICRDHAGESVSGYYIAVNAPEPYRRRRFTIAHECAHYLLHRDKIGDTLSDDAMYRSDNVTTQEEFQANNLAAELLMPRKLMSEAIRRGFDSISDLARKFDVSEPAMKVRMRYLYQLEPV
jgi:Zn-dependent peptidase ImmA (M78 family)